MKKTLLVLGVAAAILAGCNNSSSSLPYATTITPSPVPTTTTIVVPTPTPTPAPPTPTPTPGPPTPTPTPTPVPTATAAAFTASFVTVPFLPTPYPSPATQINYPGVGTAMTVTLMVSGGKAPFTATANSACGNFGNSTVSISTVSGTNNQFNLTPTSPGGPCLVTFSDSSTPVQTTVITIFVDQGTIGPLTMNLKGTLGGIS
jgi:hypothetical protein